MWTQFMDMHSGGGTKEPPYQYIYIEAPENEARVIFYNRFGHNPDRVTCTCCGNDYSISQSESLDLATGFERGCDYAYFDAAGKEIETADSWASRPLGATGRYVERPARKFAWKDHCSLEDYMKREDVMFIPASHIKPEWRRGDVPDQGYVWVD